MKYYKIDSYGNTYNVRPVLNKYESNGTLAVRLIAESGEPFCNLTVNLPTSIIWADQTTAFIDTNNCPWAEEFIEENNLGTPVGYTEHCGFCTYPLYKFNLEEIA